MKYEPLSPRPQTNWWGKMMASGFFAIFAGLGIFLTVLMGRSVWETVLGGQSWFHGFVLLFPLILVGIGLGGIWAVWRRAPGPQPVPERAGTATPCIGWLRLFFLPFLLVGGALLWSMTLAPLLRIVAARSWVPTPAWILSSRVVAQNDSDGSSYRVDILYAYRFGGVERQSSQYDFSASSSQGYATQGKVVSQYPVGAAVTCYVNPAKPSDAVLRREPHKALWFGALGLVFLCVGGAGIAASGRLAEGAVDACEKPLPRAVENK